MSACYHGLHKAQHTVITWASILTKQRGQETWTILHQTEKWLTWTWTMISGLSGVKFLPLGLQTEHVNCPGNVCYKQSHYFLFFIYEVRLWLPLLITVIYKSEVTRASFRYVTCSLLFVCLHWRHDVWGNSLCAALKVIYIYIKCCLSAHINL